MTIGVNNTLNTIKDLISIFKEIKPVFSFISNGRELTQSQIRTLKLFLYYFLAVIFLMGMLASITLMLVKLPLFSGDINSELVYRISSTAEGFMNTLILTGYLFIIFILIGLFLFGLWHTTKKAFISISNIFN